MTITRVVTGITVERKLFRFPRGTTAGAPVCEADPSGCCSGAQSGSGSGSGSVRDVAAVCSSLSGYLFPRRVYLTIGDYSATPGCVPGDNIGCAALFAAEIPLDWDGVDSWRASAYQVGTCTITIQLAQVGGPTELFCFQLSGFWSQLDYPYYSENINHGMSYVLLPAAVVPYPFYVQFETPDDSTSCAGLYYITE